MQKDGQQKNNKLTVLIVIVIWGLAAFGFLQHQAISDWWRLRDYKPAQEIVALADQDKFTASARRLFYVYHPSVAEASTFNQKCTTNNEYSIILGCYISGQGIYVFKVDDVRLEGVKQVTSAHELLHAAYERLSSKDRSKIDTQLADVYSKLSNQRIKDTVEQYRASDPSVVPNELHSILGTELRNLTPELEKYYSKYFNDRSVIVGYSETYEKAFSDRKAKIDNLEAQLKTLRNQINDRSEVLANTQKRLAIEYGELESQRDTISPALFNSRAAAYNRKVVAYNTEVQSITATIDSYNGIYNEYKQLVTESQDLYKSINSRPEILPSS